MSKRIRYLDYAKGLTILVLLFSHSRGAEDQLQTWISSWHMPIFFVICGMLAFLKIERKGEFNIRQHIWQRIFNLFVPYFLFGFILIVFFTGLQYASGHSINAGPMLFKLFTLQGIESMWFLPTYFAAELLFIVLFRIAKTWPQVILALCLVVFFSTTDFVDSHWAIRLLCRILRGYIFVVAGFVLAQSSLVTKIHPALSACFLLLSSTLALHNGYCSMFNLDSQHTPLYFVDAILTSIAILSLLASLDRHLSHNMRLLNYFGQNTIIIVCTNNLVIETLRLADFKLSGNTLLHSGLAGSFVLFVLAAIIELAFIEIFKGRFTAPKLRQ